MPLCIICHLDIDPTYDVLKQCPNEHPVHEVCLKEWLKHAKTCPVCSEPYEANLLDTYKGYLQQQQKDKTDAIQQQQLQKTIEIINTIARKVVFLKQIEVINHLGEIRRYDEALERLEAFGDETLSTYRGQHILFLKGKINFLRDRYDLAINSLFKLVKEKFDFPDAFLYLGKAYEELGMPDKAKWAYDRAK